MKKRKLAASVTAAFAAGLAAFALGGVSIVSTVGNSMEPGFRTGDLAIIRPADAYAIGDVVAYHSAELDTVVMHRIVAAEDDRFVLQGDNNSWLDPETPTSDDMVGTLALRVPQGGMWLDRLTSGPILGLGAFGLIASGGAVVGSRRRTTRRSGRTAATTAPRSPRRSRPAHATARTTSWTDRLDPSALGLVALGLAVAGGALATIAFARPLLTTGTVEYEERATLGYDATVAAGAAYPEGEIRTGDVVFRKIADRVRLVVAWQLAPSVDHPTDAAATGTAVLTAEIADSSGWKHELPIAESTLEGPSGSVEGTLDLGRLQRTVSAMQAATGTSGSSQTVTVTADLRTDAVVAGVPVATRFSPAWSFTLDALRFQPPTAGEGAEPFVTIRTGTIEVPEAAPAQFEVAGRSIAVAHARTASLITAAAALIVTALALLGARRRTRRSPMDVLRSRHTDRLVEAVGLAPAAGRTVVQLRTLDDLGALAEKLDLPLIAAPRVDGGTTFVVDDLSTQYRVAQLPASDDPPTSSEGRNRPRRAS